MGFWAFNLDTLLVSLLLGLVFIFIFRLAARKISAGVPIGLQNFCEWSVEFVDSNVRGSFSARNDMVAPLALTIFLLGFFNEPDGSIAGRLCAYP